MKCIVVQRRLLGCERPDAPPESIAAHLQECEACRGLQQRLLELERDISSLPVPAATTARTRLLEKVLSRPAEAAPGPFIRPPLPRPAWLPSPRERALQKLALALALAAALLLFAVAWWAAPRNEIREPMPPPVQPTLAQTLQDRLQVLLVAARTPRERVHQLADLAEEVRRQALRDKADRDKLPVYARFYGELVRDHLVVDAGALPAAERPSLEAIAGRLRKVESEARRLAADPAQHDTASSWGEIAQAADHGARRLHALARGEAA